MYTSISCHSFFVHVSSKGAQKAIALHMFGGFSHQAAVTGEVHRAGAWDGSDPHVEMDGWMDICVCA